MVMPKGWHRTRLRVIARDEGICWLCGQAGADSADHVIPRAYGGTNEDDNLRAAHVRCNSRRGGQLKGPKIGLPRARIAARWRDG
jgi:5-methylcytosine-specific restriction endonuclease McrA